jgi:c-di-GMP-binding flagellar brake protein YcgR
MEYQLEEKRRFPRIKLKSPMRYQIRGLPDFDNAICDNISAGGIGFLSNKFIAPRTLVMLEINLLSRILRPIGKIAASVPLPHCDRNRLGVEFLELDNKEKLYLQNYINMQLP